MSPRLVLSWLPWLLAACATAHPSPQVRFSYQGVVVNTQATSRQYGNLLGAAGGAAGQPLTFVTEATTTSATSHGPLKLVQRTGTTTIYAAPAPGDFEDPASFSRGTPVEVSTLQQQVVVDTTSGLFTVTNLNLPQEAGNGGGRVFRSTLTGRLDAGKSPPSGWFGGVAVEVP